MAGGHPHLSPPSLPVPEESTPSRSSSSQVALPDAGDSGGQLDQVLRSRAERPSVQCGKWAGTQQHTPGEKDGVAVVTSVSGGFKKKKKGKPNSSAIPQRLVPVWKPAGLRLRVPIWGKASWAPLSLPSRRVGHRSMASSLLGNPCWARGRDRASPSHPARGRVRWKLSLKSSGQWQSPWDSP